MLDHKVTPNSRNYRLHHAIPGLCLGLFLCVASLRESAWSLLLLIAPLALVNTTFRGGGGGQSDLNHPPDARIAEAPIPLLLFAVFLGLVILSTLLTSDWSEVYPVLVIALIAALLFFHCLYFGESAFIAWGLLLLMFLGISVRVLMLGVVQKLGPQAIVDRIDIPLLVVPNDYAALLLLLPLFMGVIRHFPIPGLSTGAKQAMPVVIGSLAVLTSMVLDSSLCLLLCLLCFALALPMSVRAVISPHRLATGVLLLFVASAGTGLLWKFGQLPTSRIPVWDAALHQIAQSPLLGSSLDSFSNFYLAHIARTDYGDLITVDQRGMPWAHNLFLDVALSFGVPAALILLALLVTILLRHQSRLLFQSTLLFITAAMVELTHLRIYTFATVAMYAGLTTAATTRKTQ